MAGLHVVRIHVGSDRAKLLESFSGHDTTWIVADVRSKLAIQRRILERNGFADGHAVLRASELWTKALRRLEPDLQIVSRELILAAISANLRTRSEPWLKAPGAAKTAFEYIRQLLPILSAETESAPLLDDWFEEEENEGSKDRWKVWYQTAREIWSELHRSRLCAASWVPGKLVSHRENLSKVISRALVVDLGAQLSQLEAELLLSLAKTHRVVVLRPAPDWEADYPDGRLSVDWMIKEAPARGVSVTYEEKPKVGDAPALSGEKSVFYRRLPSGAAEVKEAVACARAWLQAGVAPSSIAIVAPDLESYWSVLSLHLEVEGIPASKSVVSMLHSFSDVMRWLARLRIRTGIPESRDLEVDLFGEAQPPISFVSFREIFSRVYEAADLSLSKDVVRHFETQYRDQGQWNADEVLSRDQFLAKALSILRETDDATRAIRLFKAVLEECPPDISFECVQWVRYLGDLAARNEVQVIAADPFGVQCLNLASLEGVECTHAVILGLHEGALRSQHGTAIHTTDLRSIERGTGFVIDGEDRKRVEFEARWILSQPRIETHLLFAEADVGGTVQTPSWTWISGAWAAGGGKTPEITVARATRFDLLQSRDRSIVGSSTQRLRAAREAGTEPQPHFGAGLVKRLSATTIDQVSKCSLRFVFDRILGPRDEGILDLDADQSRHGRLQHKIFELLGREQFRSHSDDELNLLIEQARADLEAVSGTQLVRTQAAWLSLRRRLVRVSRWLIEFEQEHRRRWPNLRTVATEGSFRGVISADGATSGGIEITGQIDRIDQFIGDERGRLWIIDYKNRAYAQNFSSWRKSNFWQPFVYAYAIENGWWRKEGDNSYAEIAGIFIYDVRDRSKGTGLRLREGNEDIFDFTSRSKGQSREDLDAEFTHLEATFSNVAAKLETGEFVPVPSDVSECERCGWRNACRAPHLEQL